MLSIRSSIDLIDSSWVCGAGWYLLNFRTFSAAWHLLFSCTLLYLLANLRVPGFLGDDLSLHLVPFYWLFSQWLLCFSNSRLVNFMGHFLQGNSIICQTTCWGFVFSDFAIFLLENLGNIINWLDQSPFEKGLVYPPLGIDGLNLRLLLLRDQCAQNEWMRNKQW